MPDGGPRGGWRLDAIVIAGAGRVDRHRGSGMRTATDHSLDQLSDQSSVQSSVQSSDQPLDQSFTIPQWRNLVFEGGGVKGIAAVGAVGELRAQGHLDHIVRVAGTSAGAINALIFALGYSIEEQQAILQSTDFEAFLDESFGLIRDVRRLAKDFGWHRGEFFRGWLGDLIEAKLGHRDASFKDLLAHDPSGSGISLSVIGTNLSTGYATCFSAQTHPTMTLLDAVRISMSIPLFFKVVRFGPRQDVYVDGGVQLNYPIQLFDHSDFVLAGEGCAIRPRRARHCQADAPEGDRLGGVGRTLDEAEGRASRRVFNCQTLGIRLDTQAEIAHFRDGAEAAVRPMDGFGDYAKALIGSLMNQESKRHLDSEDWVRTVYVDTLDVGTTDFGLSEAKKAQLLAQGVRGARDYLAWFDGGGADVIHRMH